MPGTIARLKKLRGRSLGELRERGRQELSKLTERFLQSNTEMSDRALLRSVNPDIRNGSVDITSSRITGRLLSGAATAPAPQIPTRQRLFPLLSERRELVETIKVRFPEQADALVGRADRAIEGRFDLLGYSDVTFGSPIDWRLEPVSGLKTGLEHWSTIDYLNPAVAGDKKLTWELNRHAHFVTLGQAYWITGQNRYASAFVEQATSWMDQNPLRLGINWASSLEVSLRSIAWLWALHLMADAPPVTSKFVTRLLKCLIAHGRHVSAYLSHYFSANTHLTGEALGLVYLGTALADLSYARRWKLKGLSILLEQFPLHVRPDGVYFEQSTYYQRYTVDFYTHLALIARTTRLELPDELASRLALAIDHLMWITRPDGTSPLVGDDDGGRLIKLGERPPNDFRDTLASAAALFHRGDWKHVAGQAPVETLWLLGTDGLREYDGLTAVAPAQTGRAFVDGGYFVFRDGWDRTSSYAFIDCGPHGGAGFAHAHADALSFEFAARGTTWFVDPGTFTYTSDAGQRDWFRSSLAHNTTCVDQQTQSISDGTFKWARHANATAHEFISNDNFCYVEGSHDGYERLTDPVTQTRSFLFVKSSDESSLSPYLIIRDSFDAKELHQYHTRFQLAAGSIAQCWGNTIVATAPTGQKLSLSSWSSNRSATGSLSGTTAQTGEGWVSIVYGQKHSAPVLESESTGSGRHQMVTIIVPQSQNGGLASVSHARGVYSISTADSFDLIACPEKRETHNNLLVARCQLAWIRFTQGRVSRGCMIRGSRLDVAGSLSIRSSGEVGWLTFHIDGNLLQVSEQGATQLDITIPRSVRALSVNGFTFDVGSDQTQIRIGLTAGGWELKTRN